MNQMNAAMMSMTPQLNAHAFTCFVRSASVAVPEVRAA